MTQYLRLSYLPFMLFEKALEIVRGLGRASKMPCRAFSISAWRCKRGSKLRHIPGSICNKCYAIRGHFARPSVQNVLHARQDAMSHPLWAPAMAVVLKHEERSGFFRWYASGDMQSLEDAVKICRVVRATPHLQHWLPTHEVGILGEFKRRGYKWPKNLTVRLSADMLEDKPSASVMKRLGVRGGAVSKQTFDCPAYSQGGTCGSCRRCWDKRVSVVTYKYH